jgi:dolichol-phosphate mannosyltransferase
MGGQILNRSLYRNLVSTLANMYNRALLGLSIRDISSGYKCYRREVIEALDFDRFLSTGYSIGAETLYKIKKKEFTMKEIAITFKNREAGVSKCGLGEMIDYLIKIFLLKLKEWR